MGQYISFDVEVIQADIESGKRKDCIDCAFALACRRTFPECHVVVSIDLIMITRNPKRECALFMVGGRELTNWLRTFDAGEKVLPRKFTLKEKKI